MRTSRIELVIVLPIALEPVVFTDDAAESYTEGTSEVLDPVYDFFAAEIARLTGKGAKVLDVGTGHGIVIGKVAKLTGAETIGIDASPSILMWRDGTTIRWPLL